MRIALRLCLTRGRSFAPETHPIRRLRTNRLNRTDRVLLPDGLTHPRAGRDVPTKQPPDALSSPAACRSQAAGGGGVGFAAGAGQERVCCTSTRSLCNFFQGKGAGFFIPGR